MLNEIRKSVFTILGYVAFQILDPDEVPLSIVFNKYVKTDLLGNVTEYCESDYYELQSSLVRYQEIYNGKTL